MTSPPPASRILSVIVPVKNGGRLIGCLLERLSGLPRPPGWEVEIVVGYQDSTDGTLAVLQTSGAKIVHCQGSGPAANRNAAVTASRGELLYFIDADARPRDADFLLRLVQAATRWDKLGALGGPILLEPSQRFNPVAIADHYASWFCWHAHRKSGRSSFQPSVNLLMPRRVFDAAGGFDERLHVLEDLDLECRVRGQGLEIYFDREVAVQHHARGDMLDSWRHSWRWGLPVRTGLYLRLAPTWPLVSHRGLFWLHGPRIMLVRLAIVFFEAARDSVWRTAFSSPFLVATVLAWTLAVMIGEPDSPMEDAGAA